MPWNGFINLYLYWYTVSTLLSSCLWKTLRFSLTEYFGFKLTLKVTLAYTGTHWHCDTIKVKKENMSSFVAVHVFVIKKVPLFFSFFFLFLNRSRKFSHFNYVSGFFFFNGKTNIWSSSGFNIWQIPAYVLSFNQTSYHGRSKSKKQAAWGPTYWTEWWQISKGGMTDEMYCFYNVV